MGDLLHVVDLSLVVFFCMFRRLCGSGSLLFLDDSNWSMSMAAGNSTIALLGAILDMKSEPAGIFHNFPVVSVGHTRTNILPGCCFCSGMCLHVIIGHDASIYAVGVVALVSAKPTQTKYHDNMEQPVTKPTIGKTTSCHSG